MPVSLERKPLFDAMEAAATALHADPTNVALQEAKDMAHEALLDHERQMARNIVRVAIDHTEIDRKNGLRLRLIVTAIGVVTLLPLVLTVYHHEFGTEVLSSHLATVEAQNAALRTELNAANTDLASLQATVTSQGKTLHEIWPSLDSDMDGILDRLDRCANTPLQVGVFSTGDVIGCSTDQIALYCQDQPAVPTTAPQFGWDMTHCPAGVLPPGQRLTCNVQTDVTMMKIVKFDNCQIH